MFGSDASMTMQAKGCVSAAAARDRIGRRRLQTKLGRRSFPISAVRINGLLDRRSCITPSTRSLGQAAGRPRATQGGFAVPARASTRVPATVHQALDHQTKDRELCTRRCRKTLALRTDPRTGTPCSQGLRRIPRASDADRRGITKIASAPIHKSRDTFDGRCPLASMPHSRSKVSTRSLIRSPGSKPAEWAGALLHRCR
jgi:hypothetical protein